MDKKNYDKETIGVIKKIKNNGIDFPSSIVVEYTVDGKKYVLNENLIMKRNKKYVFGFIPIGYTTKSLIELRTGVKAIVGNNVKIKYDTSNPQNAYLVDNVGKVTWN